MIYHLKLRRKDDGTEITLKCEGIDFSQYGVKAWHNDVSQLYKYESFEFISMSDGYQTAPAPKVVYFGEKITLISLARVYFAVHREGYEQSETEDEAMNNLVATMCNAGLDGWPSDYDLGKTLHHINRLATPTVKPDRDILTRLASYSDVWSRKDIPSITNALGDLAIEAYNYIHSAPPTPKADRLDLTDALRSRLSSGIEMDMFDRLRSAYAELDARADRGEYKAEIDELIETLRDAGWLDWPVDITEGEAQADIVERIKSSSLLNALGREIGELVEGLEFYGDEGNWTNGPEETTHDYPIRVNSGGNLVEDKGETARNLLAKQMERDK